MSQELYITLHVADFSTVIIMTCETISNAFGKLTLIPRFNVNTVMSSEQRSMHHDMGLESMQVYTISFVKEEYHMEDVIDKSLDLFETLIKHFENKKVEAAVAAQVNYAYLNNSQETIQNKDHYFRSPSLEVVKNVQDFYRNAMRIIQSFMTAFQLSDCRVEKNYIKHIHIVLWIWEDSAS